MLTNPFVTALLVPFLLIACGAICRKLVRSSDWRRSDFFLGVELALAALSAGLINFFDLARLSASKAEIPTENSWVETAVFVAVTFFMLLCILAFHQEWERRPQDRLGQIIWLGFVSNIVGGGLLAGFILLVKGLSS